MRQQFHISKLRTAVRKIAKSCVHCMVYKCAPKPPRMAPLPSVRLTPYIRPFTFIGIDYCGPFLIRSGRSNEKRWVMLITCLTLRAIHVEVASTLSTESCKLAIRRFIARRGSPQEIYSDQGTYFLGASRELAEHIESVNNDLSQSFTNATTQWHLNPPVSPHMGEAWEHMVRSVKTALTSLSSSKKPDHEAFCTILTEAESIVNSRPLTYLHLDADEDESLTPNHFIMLSSSGVLQPVKPPTDVRTALRANWSHVQMLLDQFWTRWIREYLPIIADRSKWIDEVKPIEVGDLVVIVDEAVRNSWTRGRVIKVYFGNDGRIRKADVQTKNCILQRPVTKIAVLEISTGGFAKPDL
ncbi:uncharacterized protein LOC129729663 [Wyeomyia smithii]|uniref:uncharacterized protein LOC129729663 n=1 Tax=Wyeomyia smithii TaxID=174621 RepID=UPI00246821F3|nr:uncharacterized protein LOC129729663 [Wyeomyia smithii]